MEESAQEDTTEETADRNPPSSTVSKRRDQAINLNLSLTLVELQWFSGVYKNNTEMYERYNGTI